MKHKDNCRKKEQSAHAPCHEQRNPAPKPTCKCKQNCCCCREEEEDKQPCCGKPQAPNRPDYPPAPGWQPGNQPAINPLKGITDPKERSRKFKRATIDIISGNGGNFGKRKDEYLPYLLIRANAGDRGNRPLGVPFWESPDVFVAPNLDAGVAPDTPTTLGGVAQAGAPNTLWARLWNLGRAPVYNARVEFYWFDPTMGFNAAAANLIGVTHVDLGNRYSNRAQAIVKCPVSWVPTFLNGGHECLMVRVFEPLTDPLTPAQWDASNDRHIGQRNISVVNAASPATLEMTVRLGCGAEPGTSELWLQEVKPDDFSWLSILENKREHGYCSPAKLGQEVAGFMPPVLRGTMQRNIHGIDVNSADRILNKHLWFERTCDEQEIRLYIHVDGLKPGECKIYRIYQTAQGKLLGGYTVVARKPH